MEVIYGNQKESMKKKLVLLLFALIYGLRLLAITEAEAQDITRSFYKNMEILSGDIYPNNMRTNQSVEAENAVKSLFIDKADTHMPNEIAYLQGESSTTLPIDAYTSRYWMYAMNNGKIDFRYNITKCNPIEGPSKKGDHSSSKFYTIVVKKTIKIGSHTGDFDDVITIESGRGKIVGIGNASGGYSPQNYDGNDYYSLLAKAVEAYSKKDYVLAYDTYKKITETSPDKGNAYYKLALMIYFKKGIKNRFKNNSERMATLRSYLRKAMSLRGNSDWEDIYIDATNLEYTLDNALV